MHLLRHFPAYFLRRLCQIPRRIFPGLARAQGKAARADAAQQNSYETFPPFAAAVIIAHATGNAAQFTINFWALLFVASRIGFIYCYISDKATLRSAMFGVNLLCIVALFIAAI